MSIAVENLDGVSIHYRYGSMNSDAGVIDEVWRRNCYAFKPEYLHGNAVIDIGANIGVFSLYAARYGHVLAYEPQKDNYQLLMTNIVANNADVEAYHIALGAPGKTIMSAMGGGSHMDAPTGNEVTRISLNDVPFTATDFLKMDCEGAEYQIFDNASDETLKKINRLAIEFHPFDQAWHDEVYARLATFFDLETIYGGIVIGVKK